jgi:hypothetical protein
LSSLTFKYDIRAIGGIPMDQDKAINLAERIIQLDLKRDELFEELIAVSGNDASELLRRVQNFNPLFYDNYS